MWVLKSGLFLSSFSFFSFFIFNFFIFVICEYYVCGYTDVRPQYVGVREVCRDGTWWCLEGTAAVPSSHQSCPWSWAILPLLNSYIPCTDTSIPMSIGSGGVNSCPRLKRVLPQFSVLLQVCAVVWGRRASSLRSEGPRAGKGGTAVSLNFSYRIPWPQIHVKLVPRKSSVSGEYIPCSSQCLKDRA